MPSPTTGAWRTLRALVVLVVVVGLATTGHLLAGGAVASWRAVVLALLLVGAAVAGLTSLRLTGPRLLALLGAGQVVVHHALAYAPGGHCAAPTGSADLFASTTVVSCGQAEAHVALWADPAMLLGHLVATLVAAAVVGRGERLLWDAADLLRPRPLRLPEAVPAMQAAPAVAPVLPSRPYRAPLSETDPLRGPPVTPLASPVPV